MGLYEDRKGHWLVGAGLVIHAFSIIQRWGYTGLIPLSEKRDNISLMAFTLAGLYFHMRLRRNERDLSIYALPLVVALIFVAIGHRTMDSITPFMQTGWFYLHALSYFAAYGVFGLSAALAARHIITGAEGAEWLSYRLASTGWVMLSLSLLFGSVWFYMAYGTYWLWTSREMWISITWLFYGLYLHSRLIGRLKGRTAAALGILAYLLALFTYFGVGTAIKSPPTQF